jgi:hypothetical protein
MKLGSRQKSNAYKIFLQQCPGEWPFGTPVTGLKDDIKMGWREDGRGKKWLRIT